MNRVLTIIRSRRFKKIFSLIMIVYLGGALALYFLQDIFIFRSRTLPANFAFSSTLSPQEITIPLNAEDTLHAVLYRPKDGVTKGLVLYFHGNRQNITWYEKFVPYFTQQGYEILMPDYPGYGKSRGTISEEKLYQWSALTYQIAHQRYAADSLIIYGKSLGTGIAAQLASRRDCRELILETPYYCFPDVMQRFLPVYPMSLILRYELPTYQYLPLVNAPITIFHGTQDGLIPYAQARRLSTLFKKQDRLITIEGGSHNDLYTFPKMTSGLSEVLLR